MLVITSGIVKNYGVYYDNELQNCQLYFYLVANSGQGKGAIEKFKRIGLKFHSELSKQYNDLKAQYEIELNEWEENGKSGSKPIKPKRQLLFLAGNSTKAALLKSLADNNGYGLIFETEADTLTTANKGEHGSFTEALRQGFHSEGLMVNRLTLDEPIEIPRLILSVFLSSTIEQCFSLMPTYDNGLMSRFIYYVIQTDLSFRDMFGKKSNTAIYNEINKLADLFNEIGHTNLVENSKLFEFTKVQEQKHFAYFSFLNEVIINANKPYLKAHINRLGLIFTRICMLLSYIRNFQGSQFKSNTKIEIIEEIKCTDLDFDIAIAMIQKLFCHLLQVDNLYHTLNPKKTNAFFIPNVINSVKEKQTAVELHKKGLSYSEIAKIVLNDASKKGTIHRWVKKYPSFPVSETETTKYIDVIKSL